MDPVVAVSDVLSVCWPMEDGTTEEIIAMVVSIKKCSRIKNNSNFQYTLRMQNFDIDSEQTSAEPIERNTRLLHLKWKIARRDENIVTQKIKRVKRQRTEIPGVTDSIDSKTDLDFASDETLLCKRISNRNGDILLNEKKLNVIVKKPFKHIPSHSQILAPMVGGSELAFRLLCRRYGVDLAYTPMMNSERFAIDEQYRNEEFQSTPTDRPLVAHFSANHPQTFLTAVKHIEHLCDAVDLNLGCPQRIAHAGHFGSYLLDEVNFLLAFDSR